jgi:hypothetical protein
VGDYCSRGAGLEKVLILGRCQFGHSRARICLQRTYFKVCQGDAQRQPAGSAGQACDGRAKSIGHMAERGTVPCMDTHSNEPAGGLGGMRLTFSSCGAMSWHGPHHTA